MTKLDLPRQWTAFAGKIDFWTSHFWPYLVSS